MKPFSVLIIDDHPMFREALRQAPTQILLLEDDLLATERHVEIAELREFIQKCKTLQPGAVSLATSIELGAHA